MNSHELIAMLLAALFGAIIGSERQYNGKAAGLRTNTLICLGAAIFTIISCRLGASQHPIDSLTRIAAQIVTGIGFLGAGAIIQDRGGVHGLTTTAATIWLVASIGMGCGAGYYLMAFTATLLTVVILFAMAPLAEWLTKIGKNKNRQKYRDSDISY